MEILSVLRASCKDCHRCLRYCPVGAIGFGEDQARIIHEKCIYCGRCINVCPQKAKVPFNGMDQLRWYLRADMPVIASVAPSFIASMEIDDYRQFVGGLKKLGFSYVTETVHAARLVALEYRRLARSWGKPLISACCPAIVNLVEKHYPEMIPYLAPVQSPMMIHGQMLRKMFGGNAKIAFIGPCLAKVDELPKNGNELVNSSETHSEHNVDLVLTFRQIMRLFKLKDIDLAQVEPAEFDFQDAELPRTYPLRGGTIAAADLDQEFGEEQVLAVSGLEECIQTINDIKAGRINPIFLEMLACSGGCINGPEVDISLGVATRRQRVMKYSREQQAQVQSVQEQCAQGQCVPGESVQEQGMQDEYTQEQSIHEQQVREQIELQSNAQSDLAKEEQATAEQFASEQSLEQVVAKPITVLRSSIPPAELNLWRRYEDKKQKYPLPTEEEIREILERIGKFNEGDETNCGGCGYPTCREKAIAVFQGLAEEKMCVPYMKKRIESLAHVIVDSSHNGIIVVDRHLLIQEFNPAANWMFNRRKESPIGQPLHNYINPEFFQKVLEDKKEISHKRVKYPAYNLVTDQTIFLVPDHGVVIGIFTDVTSEEEQRERVSHLKKIAVEKASDVVHKQMKIVQEIASLLGETTVETKAALYELTRLMEEGDKE